MTLLPLRVAKAQSTYCLPITTFDEIVIARVKSWVAGGDTLTVKQRAIALFPAIDTSAVQFVSDSTLCHEAAVENSRRHPESTHGDTLGVTVIRIGQSRLLVYDEVTMIGEWNVYDVYDEQLRFLKSLTM